MPALVWLGRRWRTASDDFVFSSIAYFIILAIVGSLIVSQVHIERGTESDIKGCPYAARALSRSFLGLGCTDLIGSIAFAMTACYSVRGSIFEVSKRWGVPWLLYIDALWMIVAFVLTGLSARYALSRNEVDQCTGATSAYVLLAGIFVNLILCVIHFMSFVITFDPDGVKEYGDVDEYTHIWWKRFRLLCCQCGKEKREGDAYKDVAAILAAAFRGFNVVPSDIAAGVLLLHGYQQCSRRIISQRVKYATGPNGFVEKVSTQACLALRPTAQQIHVIEELVCYSRFYMAAYGWLLYQYQHCCSLPQLCCYNPLLCCDEPDGHHEGSRLCCDLTTFFKITEIPEEDVILTSWSNSLFKPVYFVAYDRRTDAVVICVRGTMSFVDVVTDLVAKPMKVDLDFTNLSFTSSTTSSSSSSSSSYLSSSMLHEEEEGMEPTVKPDIELTNSNYSDNNKYENTREGEIIEDLKSEQRKHHSKHHQTTFTREVEHDSNGQSDVAKSNTTELQGSLQNMQSENDGNTITLTRKNVRESSSERNNSESEVQEKEHKHYNTREVLENEQFDSRYDNIQDNSYDTSNKNKINSSKVKSKGNHHHHHHHTTNATKHTKEKECYVHGGMYQSAQYIKRRLTEHGILSMLECNGQYAMKRIIVMGHSLGAGVAIILGILLHFECPNLRHRIQTYAYAPPGAMMSQDVADYCRKFTVGCYCGYDFVPRFSQHTFDLFRESIFDLMAASHVPKSMLFMNVFHTEDMVRPIHPTIDKYLSQANPCNNNVSDSRGIGFTDNTNFTNINSINNEKQLPWPSQQNQSRYMDHYNTTNANSNNYLVNNVNSGISNNAIEYQNEQSEQRERLREAEEYREVLRHNSYNPITSTIKLYPCTNLIHFRKAVTRTQTRWMPWWRGKRESVYIPCFEDYKGVQMILAGPTMFIDHFPDRLYEVLHKSFEQLKSGELERFYVDKIEETISEEEAPMYYVPKSKAQHPPSQTHAVDVHAYTSTSSTSEQSPLARHTASHYHSYTKEEELCEYTKKKKEKGVQQYHFTSSLPVETNNIYSKNNFMSHSHSPLSSARTMTIATPFDHVNNNSNMNNEHHYNTNENSLMTVTDNNKSENSNICNASVSAVVYPIHSRCDGNEESSFDI